jgi:hypothetical protein
VFVGINDLYKKKKGIAEKYKPRNYHISIFFVDCKRAIVILVCCGVGVTVLLGEVKV